MLDDSCMWFVEEEESGANLSPTVNEEGEKVTFYGLESGFEDIPEWLSGEREFNWKRIIVIEMFNEKDLKQFQDILNDSGVAKDDIEKKLKELEQSKNIEINEWKKKEKQATDRIKEIEKLKNNEISELKIEIEKLQSQGDIPPSDVPPSDVPPSPRPKIDPRLAKCNNYVLNNMKELETWSGKKYKEVLYDSELDGKSSKVFREKVINKDNLYFIVIVKDNDVFGHYFNVPITKANAKISDDNMFVFTLNSNGRCNVKKFDNKKRKTTMQIQNNNDFYSCNMSYGIVEIVKKKVLSKVI